MRGKRLAKARKQRDEQRKTRKIVFEANGRAKGLLLRVQLQMDNVGDGRPRLYAIIFAVIGINYYRRRWYRFVW